MILLKISARHWNRDRRQKRKEYGIWSVQRNPAGMIFMPAGFILCAGSSCYLAKKPISSPESSDVIRWDSMLSLFFAFHFRGEVPVTI